MRIQSGRDVHPDDPSIREMRRTLILQIAALENKDSEIITSRGLESMPREPVS
jgi:hypothetical protein